MGKGRGEEAGDKMIYNFFGIRRVAVKEMRGTNNTEKIAYIRRRGEEGGLAS